MGAGAKLNPEESPEAGALPVKPLVVELKENVGAVEDVGAVEVEPNEKAVGAGAGANSDLDFSVPLSETMVVPVVDGATELALSFVADSLSSDKSLFIVVRYLIAGSP